MAKAYDRPEIRRYCHKRRTYRSRRTGDSGRQENFHRFNFHKKPGNFPKILGATRRNGLIYLQFSPAGTSKITITEVQINFKTKKFRRQVHTLPTANASSDPVLAKTFRTKKGFTEFVMISGEGFLQGVVVVPPSD